MATIGHLRVTIGYLRVTIGHLTRRDKTNTRYDAVLSCNKDKSEASETKIIIVANIVSLLIISCLRGESARVFLVVSKTD